MGVRLKRVEVAEQVRDGPVCDLGIEVGRERLEGETIADRDLDRLEREARSYGQELRRRPAREMVMIVVRFLVRRRIQRIAAS